MKSFNRFFVREKIDKRKTATEKRIFAATMGAVCWLVTPLLEVLRS
jgi:hypothetical protein